MDSNPPSLWRSVTWI